MGCGAPDDAGVFQVRDDLALVQTVDFFPPVVDDPFVFGQVAAANALSDIYAMGAEPLTALNIVAFPECGLDLETLRLILRGGYEKVKEAGAVILGGHSVADPEPKYGLAVTGMAHPREIFTKKGARPGDFLVLTKPLGTGVLLTALKAGELSSREEEALVKTMVTLNAAAARAARTVGVHACTDITGFGLLGHLYEVAEASGVEVEVDAGACAFLPGARERANEGFIPAGAYTNRAFWEQFVEFAPEVEDTEKMLLFDPQTSGGLLLAVAPEKKEELLRVLREAGVPRFRVIGRVTAGGAGKIRVRRGEGGKEE